MVGQLYQRFQAGVDDIFEQCIPRVDYKANAYSRVFLMNARETVNRVKQKVSDVLSTMDPSSLFPLFSWLNTVCVEGITKVEMGSGIHG